MAQLQGQRDKRALLPCRPVVVPADARHDVCAGRLLTPPASVVCNWMSCPSEFWMSGKRVRADTGAHWRAGAEQAGAG